METDNIEAEDAAQLRKKKKTRHISVPELDAVLKGVNLVIKCGLRDVNVWNNSSTVIALLRSIVTRKMTKQRGTEMIVKQSLEILQELMEVRTLKLNAVFALSEKNK